MSRIICISLAAIILTITVMCSCIFAPPDTALPNVPPEYYDCTEATPQVLCDAYFSRYGNISEAQYRFDGILFVFKNVEVTDLMFRHVDEDYLWVDSLIKCYCVNAQDLRHIKIGGRIDIVGKNKGWTSGTTGLTFTECIVLPAGSIQLPAPGSTGVPIPLY